MTRDTKKTDKARALREIAAVETKLRSGFPAVGTNNKISAAAAAAGELGVSKSSFIHRIGSPTRKGAWFRTFKMQPDWSLFKAQPEPPREQRRIVALEDEVSRLRLALREAHRQALSDDAIREILGTFTAQPTSPPSWTTDARKPARGKTPEVPVTIWSDWHIGEQVDPREVNGINAYNLAICEARVRRLVESTISLSRDHHTGNYPGVVVNLLGDFVSGGLHPELLKTDEEEVIPATLRARDIMVAALSRMADAFGHVYVPCAAGNHGRATQKPEFKRYVYKNFDWFIYQLLVRHFTGDKRLTFDIRPSNDVHYRVYNQRYLALHGDMLGVKGGDGIIGSIGPIMRGEVKKSRQSAVIGSEYDVLLMGHWHQPLNLPRAIVANTLKGWDEYARLQLGAPPTPPSQPLWFVHPSRGRTSYWEVYVDDPPPAASEWVAVLKSAA
jgi:hypothetical protein